MKPIPCIILAGGLATRMRPLTSDRPKSLLPVAGTPFLDRQLAWLRSEGVERVVLSTGHLGDMVRAHVRRHGSYGIVVDIVDDGASLLGTGGAVRRVIDAGLVGEAFFVLNGDSFLTVHLTEVQRYFEDAGQPAVMTVLRNRDRWERSNAVFVGGRVVLYDKRREHRTSDMEWIDYGLSLLRPQVVTDAVAPAAQADLAEVMRELSAGGRLAGFEVSDRFYEIGSPAGLRELEDHLKGHSTPP